MLGELFQEELVSDGIEEIIFSAENFLIYPAVQSLYLTLYGFDVLCSSHIFKNLFLLIDLPSLR